MFDHQSGGGSVKQAWRDALPLRLQPLVKRTSGRLFCTRNETPLGRRNVNRKLYGTLKSLGIPKAVPHASRHGRVSVLAANGVPQKLQEEWVGHSSYRITERYTHFDDSYRQKMVSESALFVADGPNGPNFEGVLRPVAVGA
jgi:integrase